MNESKVTLLRDEIDAGAYDPHGLKAALADLYRGNRLTEIQADALRMLRDETDMRGDLARDDRFGQR